MGKAKFTELAPAHPSGGKARIEGRFEGEEGVVVGIFGGKTNVASRLQIADCRLQIADCRLQIADCRLQIAGMIIGSAATYKAAKNKLPA